MTLRAGVSSGDVCPLKRCRWCGANIQVQGARGWLYVFADEKDGDGRRRYIACTLSRMWAHVRRTAFAQVSEEDLEVSLSGVPDMHLYEVCVCASRTKNRKASEIRTAFFARPRGKQSLKANRTLSRTYSYYLYYNRINHGTCESLSLPAVCNVEAAVQRSRSPAVRTRH